MKTNVMLGIVPILLLYSSNIFSQKADKNELRVTYIQLPLTPLPAEIQSYTARIHPGNVSFQFIHLNRPIGYIELGTKTNYGSVEKSEADFLILPGYKRLVSNGDLKVDFYLKALTARKYNMKTGTGQFVVEGGKMQERTYYYYEIDYSYYAALVITDKNNDTIKKHVFHRKVNQQAIFGLPRNESKEYFGGNFLSSGELETAYQEKFLKQQEIDWTREALLATKNYLYSTLGKPLVYNDFDIISGKGKQHNYADLDTAVARMKSAFNEITLNKGEVVTAEPFLKEAIAIWEKALTESDPKDKKARISDEITAGLQYNIAIASLWMRKPETAWKWLEKASTFKYGEKLIRKVSDDITNYEKRWKANGLI